VVEDRPAPVPGADPPAGRDLPAPYRDPWGRLAEDLRAVAASERLRLWQLARRNRQGDLPVPGFWPRDLRAWFWPLLLGLSLAVAVALITLALTALPADRPARVAPPPVVAPAPPEPEMGENRPKDAPEEPPERSEAATSPAAEPAASPPAGSAPAGASAASPPAGSAPAGPPPPPPKQQPIDPLLAQLQPADPLGLIRAARQLPARSCLVLEVAEAFAAQPPAQAQRQAEAWRVQALELGYERLELLDRGGRLLGRTARVGSGMILLSSAARAPDAP
jgi:hypothetical protein